MKSARIWLVGSAGLAAALVGCSLAAGLDKFDGVKLATLDGSAPIDVNPRDGDSPFPDDEEPANNPPTPSTNRDAGCDGGGGGANCVPEKRYCERLQTKPSFCQDFDVTGESLTDALAGFSTSSLNGTASLVTTDSKSAPRALFISQRALADANAKGYFFLNRSIPNTSTRVTVAYDLLIKGRDKGQTRKQDLQRIALGNYPTDWALSLNVGANLATILECRRGEGDGGTGVTCNNNDLPFIPGDNGWTRINIDLLLDRTKGTATMNVSLNGTNTIKDKVFQPHVLPPNGASTPPINVNVGTNYLVGPLGETNYLIDNVIIDHR